MFDDRFVLAGIVRIVEVPSIAVTGRTGLGSVRNPLQNPFRFRSFRSRSFRPAGRRPSWPSQPAGPSTSGRAGRPHRKAGSLRYSAPRSTGHRRPERWFRNAGCRASSVPGQCRSGTCRRAVDVIQQAIPILREEVDGRPGPRLILRAEFRQFGHDVEKLLQELGSARRSRARQQILVHRCDRFCAQEKGAPAEVDIILLRIGYQATRSIRSIETRVHLRREGIDRESRQISISRPISTTWSRGSPR